MGKTEYICVSCSKKIVKSSSSNNAPTCLFLDDTKFELCHWKCVGKMLDVNHYEGIVKGTFTPLDNHHGHYSRRKQMYRCRTSECKLCERYYNTNQKVGICYEQNENKQCYHWVCIKKFHKELPIQKFIGITLHRGGIPEVIEEWNNLDKNAINCAKRNLSTLMKYAKYEDDINIIGDKKDKKEKKVEE